MKLLVFSLLLLGLGVANSIEISSHVAHLFTHVSSNRLILAADEKVQKLNEAIDELLVEVRRMIIQNGFDPMKLEDIHKKISFKPIIITYWGELNLTNGWLQDASTIKRNGDVSIVEEGKHMKLVVPISFKDFVYDYKYSVKIMGLGPSGGVDGKATSVNINLNLDVNTEDPHVTLTGFKTSMGKISLKFNGHGLIDWLTNLMSGVITTIFKGFTVRMLDDLVRDVLTDVLDQVNEALKKLTPTQAPDWMLKNLP